MAAGKEEAPEKAVNQGCQYMEMLTVGNVGKEGEEYEAMDPTRR